MVPLYILVGLNRHGVGNFWPIPNLIPELELELLVQKGGNGIGIGNLNSNYFVDLFFFAANSNSHSNFNKFGIHKYFFHDNPTLNINSQPASTFIQI